jgi:hypothetical protein
MTDATAHGKLAIFWWRVYLLYLSLMHILASSRASGRLNPAPCALPFESGCALSQAAEVHVRQ